MFVNLAAALGVGLLIGADRERRKGTGNFRAAAGIRTFTIASLAGAIALIVGGIVLLAMVLASVGALVAIAYWRSREEDPGITTEISLLATVLLGGLCTQEPAIAGGLAVTVAGLLAAKTHLHKFVRGQLTEEEVRDALILAAATLILLPLLPDRTLGPFNALNPRTIWIVVILVMTIGAAGHIAVRLFGARFGLALAGLASGFISSTATIAASGAAARKKSQLMWPSIAAAALSTIATVVLMAIVLGTTSWPTLAVMTAPLICAGGVAWVYGVIFFILAAKQQVAAQRPVGSAFSLPAALGFAISLSAITMMVAWLVERFGTAGVTAAAALAGFVDTHSAAISVASLVASGKLEAADAVFPILAAFSTNTVSKIVVATIFGRGRFAAWVITGLVLVALAGWVVAVALAPR